MAEARSLLIRTTRGCPWNKCDFCVNYQDMPFSIRRVDEIERDIEAAAEYYGGHPFASCFLQDGDSFLMKTRDLLKVLRCIKEHFPRLERITSYGRAATMVRRSPEEMRELAEAGLNRLYCGMESGCDAVLERIHKGVKAADIVRAGLLAKQAGMEISEFLIVGLGGRELWEAHARDTARALNEIDADFIRVRTIGVKIGSRLEAARERGEYELQSETELIREQRLLLEGLEGVTGYYSNDHAVNLLMEVEGQLMADKERLLGLLDRYLELPETERDLYNVGRRLNTFGCLDDLDDLRRRVSAAQQMEQIEARYPGMREEVCHHLRERVV